jgi:hypothetical protein
MTSATIVDFRLTALRDLGVAGWRRLVGNDHDVHRTLDDRFDAQLRMQLEAARRYERSFALTHVSGDGCDLSALAQRCSSRIRILDAVTVSDAGLMLLWAESDRAGAEAATRRLSRDGLLPHAVTVRSAIFPVDGLTVAALLDSLERATAIEHRRLAPITSIPIRRHSALRRGHRYDGDGFDAPRRTSMVDRVVGGR